MAPRLSTSGLRAAWAPACTGPWAVVTLHGGARVTVDPLIVPALLALSAILERHGYKATPPDTGAYNCRRITGGSGYSLHAYGIAVDINWLDNPYGPRLVTDMPAAMVAEIEALRTVSGWQVWGWGGRYATNKDAMHYEIVCPPHELATGIAGSPRPQEWDEMASKDEVKAALREVLAEQEVATRGDLLTVLVAITGSRVQSLREKVTNLGDLVNELRAGRGR